MCTHHLYILLPYYYEKCKTVICELYSTVISTFKFNILSSPERE